MGLRTVLYGYRKEHLSFYIIPEEADIVRRVFQEYISGRTMKSIADELTANKVVYYKEKSIWTKNAVCRILENRHYAGDLEYPAIISREEYETANAMKTDKGGKREADKPETALLKRKMLCAECGHHYTRRKNYSGTRERWECLNQCKITVLLDDKALYGKLLNLMNCIIAEPEMLKYDSDSEDNYQPTLELMRRDREIDRMMEQKNPKFLPIKGAIYDTAASRFDCCRLDASKAITDKLIEYVKTLESMEILDCSLIERLVKSISVRGDGNISIRLLNDKTINEKEDISHAGDSDSTESGNKDCG